MTRALLTWDKGGTAEIIAISKDAVTLRSTVPSPPGSRIDGTLTPEPAVEPPCRTHGDIPLPSVGEPCTNESPLPAAKVRFKIHGSKRQEDGAFVLIGRPIDLEKELRAHLEMLVKAE